MTLHELRLHLAGSSGLLAYLPEIYEHLRTPYMDDSENSTPPSLTPVPVDLKQRRYDFVRSLPLLSDPDKAPSATAHALQILAGAS